VPRQALYVAKSLRGSQAKKFLPAPAISPRPLRSTQLHRGLPGSLGRPPLLARCDLLHSGTEPACGIRNATNGVVHGKPGTVRGFPSSDAEWHRGRLAVLNDSRSVLDDGGERATLAIGPFRLDVDTATLYRGSDPLPVGRRAVALLSALAKRQGLVVSKDELIQAAWSSLVVEESNLSVQIAALRKALAAEPGGERWIETLPRRGYRFVGPTSSHHSATDEEKAPFA
jgi:DNA-binding winged helix-turn-helix (wHTH) protein